MRRNAKYKVSRGIRADSVLTMESVGRSFPLNNPTPDLHFADVEERISVLNRLVTAGNSVLVIGL